jgi:hypothetical protein
VDDEAQVLKEFEGETKVSDILPYCQIINPPNLSMAQIKLLGDACHWGLFVTEEQGCRVNFKPSEAFVSTKLVFGGEREERVVDGWLSQRLRFVVINKISGIQVQERSRFGWKTIGDAYRGDTLTELGLKAEADKENYRFRTRYLLLFLNENNEPLHDLPLSLGMGRGPGASIGEEIRSFRAEVSGVYREASRESAVGLNDLALARASMLLELGIHKGKAPFVCPAMRSRPTLEIDGLIETVTRRDREVKIVSEPLSKWLILKKSSTGKLIRSLYAKYQDFGVSYHHDEAPIPRDTSDLLPTDPPDLDDIEF